MACNLCMGVRVRRCLRTSDGVLASGCVRLCVCPWCVCVYACAFCLRIAPLHIHTHTQERVCKVPMFLGYVLASGLQMA